VALRLEPMDEYLHPVGSESTFNESMYFNLYDPTGGIGAFFRLGNRPNEGIAEMTVCVYLPGGRVAFLFDRPKIDGNDRFDAGGLTFQVLEPFAKLTVGYRGRTLVMENPLDLADPKTAFASNPMVETSASLVFERISPPFGGEPTEPREAPGEEFARGHYEQLVTASGAIQVGEERFEIQGSGLRDHSWGPRTWQAPWYYRWLTATSGTSFGFMASRIARRDGTGTRGGFVFEDGELIVCDDCRISTVWDEQGPYQSAISVELFSGDRAWRATGRVMTMVPLRNRRRLPSGEVLMTRIAEGLTEWHLGGDRRAYGLAEYLDQIIDGQPVGLDE
jgi:hypothetical protein